MWHGCGDNDGMFDMVVGGIEGVYILRIAWGTFLKSQN